MKKQYYVKDVYDGLRFNEMFLVRSKSINSGKTGKKYITLELVDMTGSIDAKVWDNADSVYGKFENGDIVSVSAEAKVYNGQLQLSVGSLQRGAPKAADLADFVPLSPVQPEKMIEELKALLREHVADPHLRALLGAFFKEDELIREFMSCPGGKAIHHVYKGGLLYHTLSIAKLAVSVCELYPDAINKEMLLTGVVFHDVGKTRELSGVASYDYTEEGRLVGHIAIGMEMLQDLIDKLEGFPPLYAMLLKHMLASHHGVAEFGAIKAPQTMEAMVLSHLDDLDARIESFSSIFSTISPEESWSGYNKVYERYLFDWSRQAAKFSAKGGDGAKQARPLPESGRTGGQPERKSFDKPLSSRLELPKELFGGDKNKSD